MNKLQLPLRTWKVLFWIGVFTAFLTLNIFSFKWADDYDFSYVLEPNLTENVLQPIHTLGDIGHSMKNYYFSWGGRVIVHSIVQFFAGIAGHGWFVVANTIVFLFMVVLASKFFVTESQSSTVKLLLFTLLFWFICPIPNETLLWISGSVNYLWAGTAEIGAILLFQHFLKNHMQKKFLPVLFLVSLLCGTTHEVPSASLTASFLIFMLFNRTKITAGSVAVAAGFGLGTALVVLAPGNFVRLALPGTTVSHFQISLLIESAARVFLGLKAFWIFLLTTAILLFANREKTIELIRTNLISLLAMFIAIAMIIILKQGGRVTLFPELIATIMIVRFAGSVLNLRFVTAVLVILFVPDFTAAVNGAMKQQKANAKLLNDCIAGNGVVAFDHTPAPHRYAFPIEIADFSVNEFAKSLGLARLTIFPAVYNHLVPVDTFCTKSNRLGNSDSLFSSTQFRTVVLKLIDNETQSIKSVTLKCHYAKSLKRDLKQFAGKFKYDSDTTISLESPTLISGGFHYFLIAKPGVVGDEIVP